MRRKGRRANSVQYETVAQKRPVEGLAVEGNHAGALLHSFTQPMQHWRLTAELRKEQLLNPHGLVFEPPDTDQERHRPRPSGKAGCLGVEEQRALEVDAFERRVQGELRETLGRYVQRFGDGRPSVVMMGLEVLVDQVKLAMLGIPPLTRQRASNARNVELPGARLRQPREASFDRHRASVALSE
jgi:hypothetical protein